MLTKRYESPFSSALTEVIDKRLEYYQNRSNALIRRYGEIEVHDFRVAVRRLDALLDILAETLDSQYIDDSKRILKLQRKILNELRDTQVQILRLDKWIYTYPELYTYYLHLKEKEIKQKTRSENNITQIAPEEIEGLIFFLNLELKQNPAHIEKVNLLEITQERADIVIADYKASEKDDSATIHRTRISFKNFRYTLELVDQLFIIDENKITKLKEFQNIMGAIQDNAVFEKKLEKYIRKQKLIPEENYIRIRKRIQREQNSLIGKYLGMEQDLVNTINFVKNANT